MWFRKKPSLYEMDPKDLDLEGLLLLQSSLLAKLLLVTRNLQQRYEGLSAVGAEIKHDTSDFFAKEVKRMNGLSLIIENVLAQQTGTAPH